MKSLKYISIKQAAARYGVSVSCVWKWVQKHQYPKPIKIGGTIRWSIDSVEEFEANLGS